MPPTTGYCELLGTWKGLYQSWHDCFCAKLSAQFEEGNDGQGDLNESTLPTMEKQTRPMVMAYRSTIIQPLTEGIDT